MSIFAIMDDLWKLMNTNSYFNVLAQQIKETNKQWYYITINHVLFWEY